MINISQQISKEKSFKNTNRSYEYVDVADRPLGKVKTEAACYLIGDNSVLVLKENVEITYKQYKERMELTNNLIIGL